MQEIKVLGNMKIVTGPLAIGNDWPGVFLSAKYLHETFAYLIKDMSEKDKAIWFSKEKEMQDILKKISHNNKQTFKERTLIVDEYSKVKKEVDDLLNFDIKDIYEEGSFKLNHEKTIKYEIKKQLARTVEYKDTGTTETTLKIQKIDSFVTDDKYFRVDSELLKINDQYGYFLRGDHTFYITGEASNVNNLSDKNLINYFNILLSCIVI